MMKCNLSTSRTDISGAGKFAPIVDKNANVKVEIIDAMIPKSFPGKSFILNT